MNCCKRNNFIKLDEPKLIIYSLNLRLNNSSNNQDKLEEIKHIITDLTYDIICFQGIDNDTSLKAIVKMIETHNYSNKKLMTYPQFTASSPNSSKKLLDIIKITWNNIIESESNIDCIIITKHNIINGAKMQITNNKYCFIANIDYFGTIISVYNCNLDNDLTGISMTNNRHSQITCIMKNLALPNIEHINQYLTIRYEYRGIHILCCQSNISELYNDVSNPEYHDMIRILNALDIHRYIQIIKKIKANNSNDATSINESRTNYTLLILLDVELLKDVQKIGKYLSTNFNMYLINSIICQNANVFEDYPTIITLLLLDINKKKPVQILSTQDICEIKI